MKTPNYQPIVYALVFVIGVIIGNHLLQKQMIYKILNGEYSYPSISSVEMSSFPEYYKSKSKINAILQLIEDNYVDGFDINYDEEVILHSIMKELDPHSLYIPKQEQSFLEEDMQGSFSGVGIEFNILNDTLVVVSSISGGPSERLGILSGDRIVEVDGQNIASIGISNSDVFEKLRGEKGSEVNIKVFRKREKKVLNYTIVRGDIPLHSIDASFMIRNSVGYLKLNRFSATTNEEFTNATNILLLEGMKKLILDLRGNPGGYLGSAVYICNEFLEEGELIVYTEGKHREKDEIFSDEKGYLQDIELVILIDEGSASASEIVSGCMQDLDRAIIVGKRSFGKGSVQEEIRLDDGSAIRLTTQKYYMPSGRSIHKSYQYHKKQKFKTLYSSHDDSFENRDSIEYVTKNGRVVYGGGGVTPDSVILTDTSLNYTKLNQFRSKNWIMEFAFTYQNNMSKKGDTAMDEEIIYSNFKKFIMIKQDDFDFDMAESDEKILKNYIKALIAKNIFDNEAYFEILFESDSFVQKAIEIFQ